MDTYWTAEHWKKDMISFPSLAEKEQELQPEVQETNLMWSSSLVSHPPQGLMFCGF